jgi:hypothetical protein
MSGFSVDQDAGASSTAVRPLALNHLNLHVGHDALASCLARR